MITVSTQTTGASHALCCPNCTYMTLQYQSLRQHLVTSGHARTASLLRCKYCDGMTTEQDLMVDHLVLYHGFSRENLMLEENWFTEDLEDVMSVGNKTPASGSRKRKLTVPEKLHTDDDDDVNSVLDTNHQQNPLANHPALAINQSILLSYRLWEAAARQPFISTTSGQIDSDVLDLSVKTPELNNNHLQHRSIKKHDSSGRKAQRQNFTPLQNKQLMDWFVEHREKPYPSTEDTKELSALTSLNYAQIKKWFANKRMRSKTASKIASSDKMSNDSDQWSPDTIGSFTNITNDTCCD